MRARFKGRRVITGNAGRTTILWCRAALFVAGAAVACALPVASLAKPYDENGNFIAFESHRDGNGEIYVMDRDGNGEQNVSGSPGHDGRPSWEPSPEGCTEGGPITQRLAFESNFDGNAADGDDYDVFLTEGIVRTVSGPLGRVNLTADWPSTETSPVWSPSTFSWMGLAIGEPLIAFTSDRDGNREIYVMNRAGGARTNLTNNGADETNPDWSRDGKYVVFESDRSGTRQIWMARVHRAADGGEPYAADPAVQVTTGQNPKFDPSWLDARDLPDQDDPTVSRNNLLLYSTEYRGARYIDLLMERYPEADPDHLPFSGATITLEVTGDPGDDGGPSWAPRADLVLFDSSRLGSKDIFVMENDGTGQRSLTESPADDVNPDWRSVPLCAAMNPYRPRPAPVEREGRKRPPQNGHDPGPKAEPIRPEPIKSAKSKCTVRGGPRRDVLRGTRRADRICGLGGRDRIYGGGGNDRIFGGNGNDTLVGGPGRDRIYGGRGNDRIFAKDHRGDRVAGGPGKDVASVDRRLDRVTSAKRRR